MANRWGHSGNSDGLLSWALKSLVCPSSAPPGHGDQSPGVSTGWCLARARGEQHVRWARGALDQVTTPGPGDWSSPIIRSRWSRPGIWGLESHCPHLQGRLRPEANCPLWLYCGVLPQGRRSGAQNGGHLRSGLSPFVTIAKSPPWVSPAGLLTANEAEMLTLAVSLCRSEVFVAQSCLTLLWPHGLQPSGLPHPWDSPGKNTGVSHALLHGIFPPQGSDPHLLHRRQSVASEPLGKPQLIT